MQKQLKEIMQQFEDSQISLESYQVISDFVKIIIEVPAFIKQVEKEAAILNDAQAELNKDKRHYLPWREKKQHNKRRDMQGNALHQLNPIFPLRNLHNVHIGIQIENISDNVDWLYAKFSPDDPMSESDKKKYLRFMNKLYKKILPFTEIKSEDVKQNLDDLKFKEYNEKARTLIVGKYSIQIAKNEGNNKMHEIMSYIFIDKSDNLKREFFYADIADERFGEIYDAKDKYAHQPYSGACKRINNKIQMETNGQIIDFLDYNTTKLGSVSVNKKYLN